VSFIPMLEPDEARTRLEVRSAWLRQEVERLTGVIGGSAATVPPVSLLDTEYLLAVATAEARWVESVLTELRSGRLTWTQQDLREVAEPAAQDLPAR
jgi:hypothetical protein